MGLGICTRLVDDFLRTKPASASLTLIFTTRGPRKGAETLDTLRSHLTTHHPPQSHNRIQFQPENVELTNLLSIRTLAHKLLTSNLPHLDTVILNAGIGGWSGLNWPLAIRHMLYDIVTNTTWPRFKLGYTGLTTGPQFPDHGESKSGKVTEQEKKKSQPSTSTSVPDLGQVFCANVFGHYMLVHWLMPLLSARDEQSPSKIIWVSSIEPCARHFHEEDLMGLETAVAYEQSKRVTDLLALTYNQAAVKGAVAGFVAVDPSRALKQGQTERNNRPVSSTPTMHVAHPGICTTAIFTLYWILQQGYIAAIYLARWLGSPWATASTYTAAVAFTWLALADREEVLRREDEEGEKVGARNTAGRVKWGSSSDRVGRASIRPTEVEGWGIDGSGEEFGKKWWGRRYGRAPGARDATKEDVHEFVAQGGRVWREMEKLRSEWEARIEEYDARVGNK